MSDTKTRHIQIEEHANGDRLKMNPADGTKMLAMIERMTKAAKYSENGSLKLATERSAQFLTSVAIHYGFIEPETVSDDAKPETPLDAAHADAAEALAEQTPGVTNG